MGTAASATEHVEKDKLAATARANCLEPRLAQDARSRARERTTPVAVVLAPTLARMSLIVDLAGTFAKLVRSAAEENVSNSRLHSVATAARLAARNYAAKVSASRRAQVIVVVVVLRVSPATHVVEAVAPTWRPTRTTVEVAESLAIPASFATAVTVALQGSTGAPLASRVRDYAFFRTHENQEKIRVPKCHA